MIITEKIQHHKDKAKMLQEKFNNLVDSIANAFYEREVWRDENSKLKPKSESNVMHAAYCLAMMIAPRSRYSFDVEYNLHQATEWKSKPEVKYDYFYIHDSKNFKNRFGSTHAVYVVRKKNIKLLGEQCKEAWKYAVSKSSRPTTLGFKEWVDQTSCDDIVNILYKIHENKIDVVTNRKLYLKDIVIIYPSKPHKNFHF